jgi:hypothetical protein
MNNQSIYPFGDVWIPLIPQSRFRIRRKDDLKYYILPIEGPDTFEDKSFNSRYDAELAIEEYRNKK